MIRKIIFSFIMVSLFSTHSQASDYLKVADDKMKENVNPVPLEYSYEKDYDSSKFRMRVYQLKQSQIAQKLASSSLCQAAKNSKAEYFNAKTSSEYVIDVLKKSNALNPNDKVYTFKSAHFVWDFYLAFRDFVDISRSYREEKIADFLDFLPNGTIVQLSKHCVPNGAVAIFCDGKLYTKRFPHLQNFYEKAENPEHEKCKIGQGVRFVVEADRFSNLAL